MSSASLTVPDLFDRLSDGAHELDARAGEPVARLLDLRLRRQHFAQVVLSSQRLDARVLRGRPRDVIEKAVDELDGRRVGEHRFPPSMSLFSCRSTWPISRFSVTLASSPPPRIAVNTAAMTVQSCLTCSVAARARGSCRRAAAIEITVAGALDPTEQRRLECRPETLRDLSKPRPTSAPAAPPGARERLRSKGPEFSDTSVPSDSEGLSRA